jgi:hypothetical protein
MVDTPQDEALDDNADRADDQRRDDERAPEAERVLQRIGEIGTEHVKRGVGEIQHAHHSEDKRQACGHHEEQQSVDDAVEQPDDEGVHGLSFAR